MSSSSSRSPSPRSRTSTSSSPARPPSARRRRPRRPRRPSPRRPFCEQPDQDSGTGRWRAVAARPRTRRLADPLRAARLLAQPRARHLHVCDAAHVPGHLRQPEQGRPRPLPRRGSLRRVLRTRHPRLRGDRRHLREHGHLDRDPARRGRPQAHAGHAAAALGLHGGTDRLDGDRRGAHDPGHAGPRGGAVRRPRARRDAARPRRHPGARHSGVHVARHRDHPLHPEFRGGSGDRQPDGPAADLHLEHLVSAPRDAEGAADGGQDLPPAPAGGWARVCLQPVHARCRLQRRRPAVAGHLDRGRPVADVPLPAPAAGRAAVSAARTREAARNAPRFAWLAFILLPLVASLGGRHSAAHTALTVAGTSLFVGLYAVVVISARRRRMLPGGGALVIVSLAALYGLAATLTLVDGGGWGFLFTYAVAVAAMALPAAIASGAVVGSTALAAAVTAASGAPSGTVLGYAASTAGVGLLMRRLADLRVRNCELSSARAELARLAVAEERQRFARDLHDLLGHSLSVIALKAELAGRLLPERSDEAACEVAELEEVARGALSE